jgi:chemotaxis protein histidine kinase CheA
MNIDELQQKLFELDSAVLQNFVLDLYQRFPELSDAIETLVLFNDPLALKKAIAKRIQSLKRGRKFIDWRASAEFARNLDSIVTDIESGLLYASPKHAFELMDKFLATADTVMNRVDDSSGEIGGIYSSAVLLWLTAAKAWADPKIDWLERVYQLDQSNDYGVLDPVLPNSHILLGQDQLKQLADRYEAEYHQAIKTQDPDDDYNWNARKACVALGYVAEALKDPGLYEHSVLIDSPDPNDMQKQSIVAMYIKFNQLDGALRWLNTDWESRFELDRLGQLDQVYELSGDKDKLCDTRRQIYQQNRSYSSFERYVETLNKDEQAAARQTAISQAEQGGDVITSADLLLQLGEAERAQQLIVSRYHDLEKSYYVRLGSLVKACEKEGCLLAATACYRALLLDILNRGYSKAYTHAARYFKKLDAMAGEISDFEPLIAHIAFLNQLETDHGRKRSFWERVQK